jgi:dTDP-4-dehydrorhamnose reductase
MSRSPDLSVSASTLERIIRKRPVSFQLWGGIECTFNRVGDSYFNQLEWSGHLERPGDLERFAGLGIRALRYPVIWEMLQPDRAQAIDWTFPDSRLPRLRELGVRPIAALVHHGSGPRHASVESPGFAPGLARFARAVAERYPWIDAYTPVNEPLTTARFCGLYGVWHPHGYDNRLFLRILANECRGIVLAMREIRRVNPSAQLIQTDDLGIIRSTPKLAYEAKFENHRRWLGWDILCGKVGRSHPLWQFLRISGLSEKELFWFQENPCPPDVIGINHYPTSDRYLDENRSRYENAATGSNGRDVYADIEAVRVHPLPPGGFYERLMEAWNRYQLPLAITESHLGCTREEQIRWFAESWRAAERATDEGVQIRAVTAWSLLGAFNWNSLVTRDEAYYEPGVFDVRATEPRPTAIATLLRSLGSGEEPDHPALQHPGWWHRPERLFKTHREPDGQQTRWRRLQRDKRTRPLLVLGASGTLGQAFSHASEARGLPYHSLFRRDLDLSNAAAVERVMAEIRPWAVINATGYVRVDEAEGDESRCFEINTRGALHLATACARHHSALLCFSSDLVFDGLQQVPYVESDDLAPLNVYGRSKATMEKRVLAAHPAALVARTSAFFGPRDPWNFVTQTLQALRRGETVILPDDVIVSPTYVPDLVAAAFDLLIDGASGVWHLANAGQTSWAQFAHSAAGLCGVDAAGLQACSHRDLSQAAMRPCYSVLGTEKGQILPTFDTALARYAIDVST